MCCLHTLLETLEGRSMSRDAGPANMAPGAEQHRGPWNIPSQIHISQLCTRARGSCRATRHHLHCGMEEEGTTACPHRDPHSTPVRAGMEPAVQAAAKDRQHAPHRMCGPGKIAGSYQSSVPAPNAAGPSL
jgi:hypothetical protein